MIIIIICYNEFENVFQIGDVNVKDGCYRTKQKEMIINYIMNYSYEFTVKDIYLGLNKSVGLTTIYRVIDDMVEMGKVYKTIGHDNITYYEYLESCDKDNHFFLKCDSCGKVIHVDCDCVNDLFSHVTKEHKFSPSHEHIIIHGLCRECL